MRFSGTNGTTITLPADENEIAYLSAFKWTSTGDISFSGGTKDVTLKVSNGYTPYIYGEFLNTSSNKITVKNGNDTYTRNLSTTNLSAGKSGCFTLPTLANYSSAGWTRIVNEEPMTLKDMMEKPMGMVNIDMKTNSYQTIREEVAKSYKISDNSYEDTNWFTLRVDDNESCSNLTYQGLPFVNLNIFDNSDNIGVYYYFRIEKSKASNEYTGYLNKIIEDFKNLNITLERNNSSTWSDQLAHYNGHDAAENYYTVNVREYGTNKDQYEFYIAALYYNKETPMTLKDMLEKPMGTVNVNMKTKSYQTVRDETAKYFTITDFANNGSPWFDLTVSDNAACSNLTYQGLPFNSFSIFKEDNGLSVMYWFLIDKSKASYNYTSYLNKIIQDFKNLKITLEEYTSSSSSDYLATYRAYDASSNYYYVAVSEYRTDYYLFTIMASYTSSSVRMRSDGSQQDASFYIDCRQKARNMIVP